MKYKFVVVSIFALSIAGCGAYIPEEDLNSRGAVDVSPPGGRVLECLPGDCNQNGKLDAGDTICITRCLIGDPDPEADCTCGADCDCSGDLGANDSLCMALRLTDQLSPDLCEPELSCGDGVCDRGSEDENNCAIDCGCAAVDSCNDNAPAGCWCDAGCVDKGDCCPDACDACGSCE